MNNNDDQYISFYDLFKTIKPIYYRYKKESIYFKRELSYLTQLNYYLDYYNYKTRKLVINKTKPYKFFYDIVKIPFYISKENGKIIYTSEYDNEFFKNIVFEYSDFFDEAISFYEKYRGFKAETFEDLIIRTSDNQKFFLNMDSKSMYFVKYLNDNPKEQEILRYTLFFNGDRTISGTSDLIEQYKKIGEKLAKKSLIINKNDLPDWCNQVINNYEFEHNNFINRFIKSMKKKTKFIEINQLNEENIENQKENSINNKEKNLSEKIKISPNLLFEQVDDHLEISKKYINNLEYIDLRNISFDGVLVSGIDFTDTNIDFIDPQKVYNKDLSFSCFGNIEEDNPLPFSKSTDFNNVNLCGTVILVNSESQYDLTNAITDSNTKIVYNKNNNKTKRKNK